MSNDTDKKDGDIIDFKIQLREITNLLENHVATFGASKATDLQWGKLCAFITDLLTRQAEATEKRVKAGMIAELEAIEKDKWDDCEHCTCLGYAIFKMKCNCDDECGKCRLKVLN